MAKDNGRASGYRVLMLVNFYWNLSFYVQFILVYEKNE